jgi:guanylate kinase
MKVGDCIKHKRKFGVITDIHGIDYHYVTHNGMKPRHEIAKLEELTLISKEKFLDWVKRKGYTSMYGYMKTTAL